jgi:hypothetical protein
MRISWPGVVAFALAVGLVAIAHVWNLGEDIKAGSMGLALGLLTQLGVVGRTLPGPQ